MSAFVWPEANPGFVSEISPPEDVESAWHFVFVGNEIAQRFDQNGQWLPFTEADAAMIAGLDHVSHYMGRIGDRHCFAVDAKALQDVPVSGLRSLFGHTDNLMFGLASRAVQVVEWYRTHQFCGRCGGRNREHDRDRAMVCDDCGIHAYPRLSPSMIVLIHRDNQVLLARNHRFPEGMYSTLAGFVEPGESVEETIRREVKEEVGVNVHNLEYQGSQSWPFPNSLMLGYLAEYESGDIVLQEDEIADAAWFDGDNLPSIPGKVAISRWLIDLWLSRRGLPVEP
ncbi:MAG: NAD(+) diphosphatase [Pseudomonadales bacterium]|nr:NAD(+) diphosphatase [Pseudomonadales bacterium]